MADEERKYALNEDMVRKNNPYEKEREEGLEKSGFKSFIKEQKEDLKHFKEEVKTLFGNVFGGSKRKAS